MQFWFFSMSATEECEVVLKVRRLPDQVPLLASLTGLPVHEIPLQKPFFYESLKSATNLRF
jgi:hypothetical protein